MSKKEKKELAPVQEEKLNIPDDEVWTYKIEGLAEPQVGVSHKNAKVKKIIFVAVIIIAVSLSLYFSVVALLNTGKLEYKDLGNDQYELMQFSNNGLVKDFTIEYTAEFHYDEDSAGLILSGGSDNSDSSGFSVIYDNAQPVSSIHEYAFDCDNTLEVIRIGANVTNIDVNAFYSCWNLQCIYVDDENPNYCDIDGVLYNKDMTEIICYPIDHDRYLRLKTGYARMEDGVQISNLLDDNGYVMEELWGTTEKYDEVFFEKYNMDVRTYVLPSTVEKIGPLCFNYANVVNIYMPEGLKEIGTLAFFNDGVLNNIYSYKTDTKVTETKYTGDESLGLVYLSLPEGLEKIGSDCFTHDRGLRYIYIPSSVNHVGHHAFWDCVIKEDGNLVGLAEVNVAASKEDFESGEIGSPWLAKYDYMLFKKAIPVNYNAQRQEIQ